MLPWSWLMFMVDSKSPNRTLQSHNPSPSVSPRGSGPQEWPSLHWPSCQTPPQRVGSSSATGPGTVAPVAPSIPVAISVFLGMSVPWGLGGEGNAAKYRSQLSPKSTIKHFLFYLLKVAWNYFNSGASSSRRSSSRRCVYVHPRLLSTSPSLSPKY